MAKTKKQPTREQIAAAEYERLIALYKTAQVDAIALKINDNLIRKTAEVFACIEVIKNLPTIMYNKNNPLIQKETVAGKVRVKYMAQYTACMQKLNKELLNGADSDNDDELDDYE